jgi:hypothetical protein
MRQRRDLAAQRMLASENDPDAAMDFAALNRALKEDQNTLAVFDQLPVNDQRRPLLASAAFDQLILNRRYDDALLGRSYANLSSLFELLSKERPLPANVRNPELVRKSQRDSLIASTVQCIEVLAGAGDLEHARELATRLLAIDDSPKTKALLQQHLARAGHPHLLDGRSNP